MAIQEQTILLVSDDAELCSSARQEFEKIGERLRVSAVSSMDAARRVVEQTAPAVILLEDTPTDQKRRDAPAGGSRLDAEVSSLAVYAPVVVIGDADRQTEMSGLIGAGVADYVVRKPDCLSVALGLVERRLRKAQLRPQVPPIQWELLGAPAACLHLGACRSSLSLFPSLSTPATLTHRRVEHSRYGTYEDDRILLVMKSF